ncbi:dynein light intermediate chain-domain-containing protein [Dichotomocladium elegans]|nr:dynein light intermediate chain-domain-containing protein [Dichotomocladium elegans]
MTVSLVNDAKAMLSPPNIPTSTQSTSSVLSGVGTQTVGSEKDEIWSGILKSVASSKLVPSKNVLVLGDSSSGKSTLVHYLKNDPGPLATKPDDDDGVGTNAFGVNTNNYTQVSTENLDEDVTNLLALGYTFADVQDEDNEVIARLGMYQLGLSAEEYLPLLKFALNADTLADSLVIITLDWTQPWKFLDSFQRWINVLQRTIDEICKEGSAGESWSRGKAVVDELREKVEHFLQTYAEPSASALAGYTMGASTSTGSVPSTPIVATPLVTTTTAADQVALPLTQGCLTTNFGVPIVVVCCKTDALNMLEQTQDYKEEQFDYIQQTLRTVFMKYGAALFYTSTLHPYTFHHLRQYILHRLLTTSTKSFPFNLKAQVIERDSVIVPAGWDSWGKIRVLREGFDCEGVSQGWDADMESIADRQQPGAHGARGVYEEVIPDPETVEQPLNISPPVTCEDEQVFFERHHETLRPSRRPDVVNKARSGSINTRPSVLGPIHSSQGAIDIVDTTDPAKTLRRKESVGGKQSLKPHVDTINTSLDSVGTGNASSIPGNEVASNQAIASFFQSLLLRKGGPGSSPTTTSPGIGIPPGAGSPATPDGTTVGPARRNTISRKEVHRELDRMRQYVNKQ